MLKPFWVKKKNIDNRLVPLFSSEDAGKILSIDSEGKIVAENASPQSIMFTIEQEEVGTLLSGGSIIKTNLTPVDIDGSIPQIVLALQGQNLFLQYNSYEIADGVIYMYWYTTFIYNIGGTVATIVVRCSHNINSNEFLFQAKVIGV